MTQYVIQILTESYRVEDMIFEAGYLIKCFKVTEKSPVPSVVPEGRKQIILTDSIKYKEIVDTFKEYGKSAVYSYNDISKQVSWQISN